MTKAEVQFKALEVAMTLKANKGSGAPSVCTNCASGYECGKLSAAMTFVEVEPWTSGEEHLLDRYRKLKKDLEAVGFSYPNSDAECHLSGANRAIRDATREVVEVLCSRTKTKPARSA